MHPDVKIKLKKEIEVFLEKNPESNVSDLRRFLKLGSTLMMVSLPKRAAAIVRKNGSQITKNDY